MEHFADIRRQIREADRQIERYSLRLRMGQRCDRGDLDTVFNDRQELLDALSLVSDPWLKVQLAREPGRPHAREAARVLFGRFQPLGGARGQGDDPAIITGIGDLGGQSVVFAGQDRGHGSRDQLAQRFGMMGPSGFRKFQRAVRWAEAHNLPLVTFVDTPSALPGIEAEEGGIAQSIARSLWEMAGVRVPTVSVLFGEGGSGGALAMALGDRVLMMENAIYSVIAPEACASILWRDGSRAEEAARYLRLTGEDMKTWGIVDEIVKEPEGGAHRQPLETLAALRLRVRSHLDELLALDLDALLEQRYNRYRNYGEYRIQGDPS